MNKLLNVEKAVGELGIKLWEFEKANAIRFPPPSAVRRGLPPSVVVDGVLTLDR